MAMAGDLRKGLILMARTDWILPRADEACGKAFYPDRRTAEQHRVALAFWNQATGRTFPGHRLTSYRCKRCGGFHVGWKRFDESAAVDGERLMAHGQDPIDQAGTHAQPRAPMIERS
jgi:hypothetical protein